MVYPVARGVGPMVTMIVALVVIGERPAGVALGGASLVLVGIVVVASSASKGFSLANHGVRWGVWVGFSIATYTLWDNRAMTVWDMDPLPYFTLAFTTQAIVLTPIAIRQPRIQLRVNWWRILTVAVLSPLGYILVLTAQKTTPISIVAPVREISIVVGAFIGWLLFKEDQPLRRIIGALIVLGGIALLTT